MKSMIDKIFETMAERTHQIVILKARNIEDSKRVEKLIAQAIADSPTLKHGGVVHEK